MIERSVLLACAPSHAFVLFTERVADWWPETLRHTSDPRSEITMLASGRFWERAEDGEEVELGWVIAWEPSELLILDFFPGTDAQHPTEVVVRFAAEAGGTRVSVEHRPKPESADLWAAGSSRFERAWDVLLPALRQASFAPNGN